MSRTKVGRYGWEAIPREGKICALALWQETAWYGPRTGKNSMGLEPAEQSGPRCVWSRRWLHPPLGSSFLKCLGFCFFRIPAALWFLMPVFSIFWLLPTLLLELSLNISHWNHKKIIWWGQPASIHNKMTMMDRVLTATICGCSS